MEYARKLGHLQADIIGCLRGFVNCFLKVPLDCLGSRVGCDTQYNEALSEQLKIFSHNSFCHYVPIDMLLAYFRIGEHHPRYIMLNKSALWDQGIDRGLAGAPEGKGDWSHSKCAWGRDSSPPPSPSVHHAWHA